MKLNLLGRLLMISAAVVAFNSCAKVNYDGRPAGILGQQGNGNNKLNGANAFRMTEGDKNVQHILQLTNNFNTDAQYSWTIVSKDPAINPADRFETLNGTSVGARGQKTLTVTVSAVNIDGIQQGTQEFSIVLTPVSGTRENLTADLTLLDANVTAPPPAADLPVLAFDPEEVESDERGEAQLTLKLSRPSQTPVVVEVELEDYTARHYRDYNGFKTPSPNDEMEQTIIIPPGQTSIDLPKIGIRNGGRCNVMFYANMKRATVQGARVDRDLAKVRIPCRRPVEPPAPPQPPPPPTPEPPAPPPPPVIDLVPGQSFVMSEGDTRTLTLQFVETFRQDMSFNWAIVPKDSAVAVAERFKTLNGRAGARAGTTTLDLDVAAVDIDNLRQGDQEFQIVLTEAASGRQVAQEPRQMTADLTLLDKFKQPAARFEPEQITAPQGTVATAVILLNETSTLPITLDIETQDGSARAGEHYEAVRQTMVIAPGVNRLEVPVNILAQTACKENSELSVVVTRIENATMERTRATITIPRDEELCRPPAPPPPVTPRPASTRLGS